MVNHSRDGKLLLPFGRDEILPSSGGEDVAKSNEQIADFIDGHLNAEEDRTVRSTETTEFKCDQWDSNVLLYKLYMIFL